MSEHKYAQRWLDQQDSDEQDDEAFPVECQHQERPDEVEVFLDGQRPERREYRIALAHHVHDIAGKEGVAQHGRPLDMLRGNAEKGHEHQQWGKDAGGAAEVEARPVNALRACLSQYLCDQES